MSKIEVDEIVKQSGSTLTLGGPGTAVTLACGATQTGFGRECSVNWQTGSLKTTTFTAVSGEGYFINQGSAITMNLPAGSAGAIVAVSDYARNFATYNLTISPNGSEKIGGEAEDAILNVDGQAATFVYVDSTKGWINVQNAEDTEVGTNPYIVATGGGGGAANGSGGGGAGGYREGKSPQTPYTASPLACTSGSNNGLPVSASPGSYPIVVGSGGGGGTESGPVFGPAYPTSDSPGGNGGSGVVIIRTPGAFPMTVTPCANTVSTTPGGCNVATFTVTGTSTLNG